MIHFSERVLADELMEAKVLLDRALAILDRHEEDDAACCVCDAIERLTGAPSAMEQWHMMTGRNPDGSTRD